MPAGGTGYSVRVVSDLDTREVPRSAPMTPSPELAAGLSASSPSSASSIEVRIQQPSGASSPVLRDRPRIGGRTISLEEARKLSRRILRDSEARRLEGYSESVRETREDEPSF